MHCVQSPFWAPSKDLCSSASMTKCSGGGHRSCWRTSAFCSPPQLVALCAEQGAPQKDSGRTLDLVSWRSQRSESYYLLGLHGSSGKLTGSTSSLNKLSVQGSGNRRSQSSSLLDMGNMSASDLDVADRTKFDKVKRENRRPERLTRRRGWLPQRAEGSGLWLSLTLAAS